MTTMTKKKGRQLFGGKSAPPEKIMATRIRKGPPPDVGMGPSEWLIPPCIHALPGNAVILTVLLWVSSLCP